MRYGGAWTAASWTDHDVPDDTRDLQPNDDLCGYPGYDTRRSYARLVEERAPHAACTGVILTVAYCLLGPTLPPANPFLEAVTTRVEGRGRDSREIYAAHSHEK